MGEKQTVNRRDMSIGFLALAKILSGYFLEFRAYESPSPILTKIRIFYPQKERKKCRWENKKVSLFHFGSLSTKLDRNEEEEKRFGR